MAPFKEANEKLWFVVSSDDTGKTVTAYNRPSEFWIGKEGDFRFETIRYLLRSLLRRLRDYESE